MSLFGEYRHNRSAVIVRTTFQYEKKNNQQTMALTFDLVTSISIGIILNPVLVTLGISVPQ